MFCPVCGTQLPDDTRFCTHCGANIQEEMAKRGLAPAPVQEKKFPILAVIIPVAVIVVALFAILLIKGLQSGKSDSGASAPAAEESAAPESDGTQTLPAPAEESSAGTSEDAPAEEPSDSQPESREEAAPAQESSIEQAQPIREATMELISTDVSEYPLVRAYFRVDYADDGAAVEGLSPSDFTIEEKLSGGDYVAREVKSAMQLSGHQGLHIALAADKSDSISETDMEKIREVMTQFVGRLNYEVGDKAEVLAFDSIVQQMCAFTDQEQLLRNGIANMSTDGATAFYNALYDGVSHALFQGGARCVIAFTDGMDNKSRYTPDQIIQYANESQVPIYIIGVGSSVDTYALKNIAESTGGRYWFIDDLNDMEEIYNEIYVRQMEIYAVEYVSDEGADPESARSLKVSVDSDVCTGDLEVTFTPTASVKAKKHDARYELIVEALSWEEASRKCQEMGGHLVTITSQEEMDACIDLAADANLKYVWIGGYTSYDDDGDVFGHWVTGEDFSYEKWADGEPSRYDIGDNEPEWYLMLWNVPELGGWTWNDQRNDPVSYVATMADKMGYIIEYED